MAPSRIMVDTRDAVESLVSQFSDPMSFFRELIQNSLDAGSQEIEIWIEYREDAQGEGAMIVHVDDFGEGMDREIIDSRLTRLFSSSKEGDLTKIGRFGIGFVSVFAIQPDAVCLDTSRGGESWRVLFNRDRTFHRIRREEPTDGTKIQIIKSMSSEEVDAFRRLAREVIAHWTRHAAAEIRFDGEILNEPFDLDCPVKVRGQEEGDEAVVGYPAVGRPFFGFYNKGMTLCEGHEELLDGVAFKVSSRYLEHTLTRDNVRRDGSFEKAMSLVRRLAEGPLQRRLCEQLAEAVASRRAGEDLDFLYATLRGLVTRKKVRLEDLDEWVLWRSLSGAEQTVARIRRALRKDRLLVDTLQSPLIEALQRDRGYVVLDLSRDTEAFRALSTLLGEEPPRANDRFFLPPDASELARDQGWLALRRGLLAELEKQGLRISDVTPGHLAYPGSSVSHLVAVTQRRWGEATSTDDAWDLGSSFLGGRRLLVVNADHPAVRQLLRDAQAEPERCASALARLVLLREGISIEADDLARVTTSDVATDPRRE